MTDLSAPFTAILYCPKKKNFQKFQNPVEILSTQNPEEIPGLFERMEEFLSQGYFAAGYVHYEASPAFDSSLKVRIPKEGFPLIWFGIYHPPEILRPDEIRTYSNWSKFELKDEISKNEYKDKITEIHRHISEGTAYQINYTLRKRGRFSLDPLRYFFTQTQNPTPPYAAYIKTDREAFCSFSPELFFSLENGQIESEPMKGTRARGFDYESDLARKRDLQSNEKDLAENIMIVDMVRNDLGRICENHSVSVTDLTSVKSYGSVWQMISRISGKMKPETGYFEIFRALFPAASITGAPKISAVRLIHSLENSARGIYTGCIGFMSKKEARFNVAIRTLRVNLENQMAEYGAGGGIVIDSDSKKEFREMRIKSKVLFVKHPEFDLLESILWEKESGYFLLEEHLVRLKHSASYFGFSFREEELRSRLKKNEEELSDKDFKVRLLINRKGAISFDNQLLGNFSEILDCIPAKQPINPKDSFLYHKTTHRQIYEKAKVGTKDSATAIFWNEDGEITECENGNLIFCRGEEQITPPVSSGLLPGVYRQVLLKQREIKEKKVMKSELYEFDQIFFINSVRKKIPVRLLRPMHWKYFFSCRQFGSLKE